MNELDCVQKNSDRRNNHLLLSLLQLAKQPEEVTLPSFVVCCQNVIQRGSVLLCVASCKRVNPYRQKVLSNLIPAVEVIFDHLKCFSCKAYIGSLSQKAKVEDNITSVRQAQIQDSGQGWVGP